MGTEQVKQLLLEELCRASRGLSADELLKELKDKRLARRILGELVRDGRVVRLPDYARRRMVFLAQGEACGEKAHTR